MDGERQTDVYHIEYQLISYIVTNYLESNEKTVEHVIQTLRDVFFIYPSTSERELLKVINDVLEDL